MDLTTRAQWDAFTEEEKWTLYSLTEKSEADMKAVLQESPECPDHGFCLPFKRQWIRDQQGLPVEKSEAMLNFDRAASKLLKSGFFS